jgi:glycosyltransferase involved in cell wall biosynthesis
MNPGRIKVIEIIADSDLGGGPTHVLGLLKNIDKKKFEPFLICPAGNLSIEAKKIDGVVVSNVVMSSKFDIISALQIRAVLEKIRTLRDPFGPIVVHVHGVRAGFLARLFPLRNCFNIYTEHRYDKDYHLGNGLNEKIQKLVLKYLNDKSDLIIAVSTSVRDFLISEAISKEKVVLIPNAIDATNIKAKKIKEANRAPIIGTIGNLNIQKGHVYLVKAMEIVLKKFPTATLEIIGEGDQKNLLQAIINDRHLQKHVTLLGKKNDVSKYRKDWDVFVLPSIAETFGITILEAMSEGIPVIASQVGGIPDIIKNKENGLLIKSRDHEKLAKAIIEILDHPVLAAKLKRGGLLRIKDFDWQKIIKKIEDLYAGPFESR